MDLLELTGKIGMGVSVLVVLIAIGLVALVLGCIVLGAYEQYSNPHTATDTALELQNATAQINQGAADIAHAVPPVAGK